MKPLVGICGNSASGKDAAADHLVESFGYVKVGLADPVKEFASRIFHFTDHQLWGPGTERNKMDSRFKKYDPDTDSDDAWMAAFHRLEKHGRPFVKEIFPDSPLLQADALQALQVWMKNFAQKHPQISPRLVLQSLATAWGRSVYSDVWVNVALRKVDSSLQTPGVEGVVISDVRFRNELDAIHLAGGFLVRVRRPTSDFMASEIGIKDHQSEIEQTFIPDSDFNLVINNDKTLQDLLKAIRIVGLMLERK